MNEYYNWCELCSAHKCLLISPRTESSFTSVSFACLLQKDQHINCNVMDEMFSFFLFLAFVDALNRTVRNSNGIVQLIALPLHFCNHRAHLQHKYISTNDFFLFLFSLSLLFLHIHRFTSCVFFHIVSFISFAKKNVKEFAWKFFFHLHVTIMCARIQL